MHQILLPNCLVKPPRRDTRALSPAGMSGGKAPLRLQVDRNLAGYLPRLAVLVSIATDRPGAWFPGPLGPYQAWFPGIDLSRDFKRAKVPGNPMKSPFCFGVFWGVIYFRK
jgi:hypothetical protein